MRGTINYFLFEALFLSNFLFLLWGNCKGEIYDPVREQLVVRLGEGGFCCYFFVGSCFVFL